MLKYVETINSGGYNLTRRIAQRLKLSFDLAEEIKKSYATTNPNQVEPDEEILVKRDNSYCPVRRIDIYEAIEGEIEELVDSIAQILEKSDCEGYIRQGIKMIGGGSLLPGLLELIEQKTNMTVTLAQINHIRHKNVSNVALFSSAISLAQKGFRESQSIASGKKDKLNVGQRVAARVKDIYQEYF